MARPRRLHVPAVVLSASLLVAFASVGCGSRDTGGATPAATAQPAGSATASAGRPSSTADQTPQTPARPPNAPVRAERQAAASEPEGVPPVITSPPEDRTVVETGPFSLKVVAKGTPPLTYQWFREGRPGIVANEAEFWMVPKLEDSGTYTVEVSNWWGKATASCRLTVTPRPKRP